MARSPRSSTPAPTKAPRPSKPRAAAKPPPRPAAKRRRSAKGDDGDLATWLRNELQQRRRARVGDAPPPPAPPVGTKKPPWLKFEGLGGGFAFVHGAGPMMEAVGKTLDWAQEILVQALLGNVPWSVVGAFLKFVLLPSGASVEDYVTDAEFEELRVSLHTMRRKAKAKAKTPARKAARKTARRGAAGEEAAEGSPKKRRATPATHARSTTTGLRKPKVPTPAKKPAARPREPGRRPAAKAKP